VSCHTPRWTASWPPALLFLERRNDGEFVPTESGRGGNANVEINHPTANVQV
jgi:hypothetical protein